MYSYLFTEYDYENLNPDEMVKMLNNVDLSDPSQANSAINIVDTLVSGAEVTTKFANKYDTTTTATTTRKLRTVCRFKNFSDTHIFRQIVLLMCGSVQNLGIFWKKIL